MGLRGYLVFGFSDVLRSTHRCQFKRFDLYYAVLLVPTNARRAFGVDLVGT